MSRFRNNRSAGRHSAAPFEGSDTLVLDEAFDRTLDEALEASREEVMTPVDLLRVEHRSEAPAGVDLLPGLLPHPRPAQHGAPIQPPPGVPPVPVGRRPGRRGTRWAYLGLAMLAVIALVVTAVQISSASGTTGSGYLTPTSAAYLNFASSGTIRDVLVKPGDQVRAGELLAEQDTTAFEAKLAADQATLYADRAQVLELSGSTGQQSQIQALVNESNQQLATAQTKAQGSLTTAQSRLEVAQARLTQARSTLAADQAQYATAVTACNASGRTSGSQPTEAQCVQIQSTLNGDTTAVNNDGQAVSQAQLALQTAQSSAAQNLALASSQSALASARQGASGASVGSATDVAAANAAVARDVAAVAADQSDVSDANIVSPVTGIVGSVGAEAGDFASSEGVRTFVQSGVASSSSGFQLFAPPAQSSSGSSSAGLNPVVIVYTTTMRVTAQVSEHTVTKLHTGQAASVTVPALGNGSVPGVIADIDPSSVNSGGKVSYLVDVTLTQTGLRGALPGMTADVTFTT